MNFGLAAELLRERPILGELGGALSERHLLRPIFIAVLRLLRRCHLVGPCREVLHVVGRRPVRDLHSREAFNGDIDSSPAFGFSEH